MAFATDLPYPPTVNTYWRHAVVGRACRVFTTKEGKEYRKLVRALLIGVQSYSGRLMVIVTAHPPDKRKRDLDNILKALLDAMQGSLYEDDSQIDQLLIKRGDVIKGGKVRVTIEEI